MMVSKGGKPTPPGSRGNSPARDNNLKNTRNLSKSQTFRTSPNRRIRNNSSPEKRIVRSRGNSPAKTENVVLLGSSRGSETGSIERLDESSHSHRIISSYNQAEDNINVVVRVRPLSAKEIKAGDTSAIQFPGSGQILVDGVPNGGSAQKSKLFSYNVVFEPAATQEDVLQFSGVKRLIEMAVEGFRCTAFCYGQTGSGKTHTLTGPPRLFDRKPAPYTDSHGLVFRSFMYLFKLLAEKSDVHFVLKASFLEIYNEKCLVLPISFPEMSIREDLLYHTSFYRDIQNRLKRLKNGMKKYKGHLQRLHRLNQIHNKLKSKPGLRGRRFSTEELNMAASADDTASARSTPICGFREESDSSSIDSLDTVSLSNEGEEMEVQPEVANLWEALAKTGCVEMIKEEMLTRYKPAENCKFLNPPRLNDELAALLSKEAREKDEQLSALQTQIGACMMALGTALTWIGEADQDNKERIVEAITEATWLLANLHFVHSKTRRQLVRDKIGTMENLPIDELLFDNKMGKRLPAFQLFTSILQQQEQAFQFLRTGLKAPKPDGAGPSTRPDPTEEQSSPKKVAPKGKGKKKVGPGNTGPCRRRKNN